MKKTSNELLSSTPVSVAITKIAIPAIIAMVITAVYNFVDTLFIGMLNSDEALAAVSIAFPIQTLMIAVGQVLGAGSATTIGRAFGYNDNEYADKTASTIIFTSFLASIIFMVFGLIFSEPIFKLFGATDRIMPFAKEYGSWMFVGALFSIPNQVFNNIARAETKAMLSMITLVTGAVLNIILDPIFMFTFGLGLEGASIATTLSHGVSFVFISQFFFRGKSRLHVKFSNFTFKKELLTEVFTSGAPVGVTQLLSAAAVSVTNVVAVKIAPTEIIGDNMIASYGVVLKILSMVQFAMIGYIQGFQPIASYSYGAKNKERFFTAFTSARNCIFVYSLSMTILLQLFSKQLVSIFTSTPEIIEMGSSFLKYNSRFLVFTALTFLLMLTFQAVGNGKSGVALALARQGFIYIPCLIIFPSIFGFNGIYYSQPTADILTAFLAMYLFSSFKNDLNIYFQSNN